MDKFKIKFWGVRGSYPVSNPDTVKIGGSTSCVEIKINDELIIIDAGTGIIKLGDQLMKNYNKDNPIIATILYSHMHHDHNQGFPFFKPAYIGTSTFYFFGPKFFQEDIGEVLSRAMLPPFFPVELSELNSAKIVHSVSDADIIVLNKGAHPRMVNRYRKKQEFSEDEIVIEVCKGYAHPKGGILFYKISYKNKSIVYASDTEGYVGIDRKLVNFARDCDILIHDAQFSIKEYEDPIFPKQGFGHSTPEMAIDVAQKANVKKLILFHHDPEHKDQQLLETERVCQAIYKDCVLAYEGLEINLLP